MRQGGEGRANSQTRPSWGTLLKRTACQQDGGSGKLLSCSLGTHHCRSYLYPNLLWINRQFLAPNKQPPTANCQPQEELREQERIIMLRELERMKEEEVAGGLRGRVSDFYMQEWHSYTSCLQSASTLFSLSHPLLFAFCTLSCAYG